MINYLANPQRFLKFARIAAPLFMVSFIMFLVWGLWQGLHVSPADTKQGNAVRIMYVHVPAAWMAMASYIALFIASFVSFVWRHNLADYGAKAFARIGATFTALCLITGSIWGHTSWGTWWQWDGRMTSVLVLFFIYLAYLFIWQFTDDRKRAAKFAAIFAMVGLVNIPIIKFSVDWWNSLHQTATISNVGAPGLDKAMGTPLLLMFLAFLSLFAWLSIHQVRTDIHTAKNKRMRTEKTATITVEDL